jgi:hypothetical protein
MSSFKKDRSRVDTIPEEAAARWIPTNANQHSFYYLRENRVLDARRVAQYKSFHHKQGSAQITRVGDERWNTLLIKPLDVTHTAQ